MLSSEMNVQRTVEKIRKLPREELSELDNFIEYLRFKTAQSAETETRDGLRLFHLRGLLAGYEFSPELLAEVRHELWRKVEQTES